ncbi:alpha/beta hydrolase [Marinobacter sp. X15-166B]|uniref:alpha/beta hydrolase n=1 Tax=Marinobacter sp. X15-166B TaxID=1897620 RepID=UPI00085BC423|nr:alpha/beta hydrolase [Marinobacter sp. X15-166B]OEY66267.1 carboxylesterase [Marinobacter sp. X15-166B]
MLSTDKLDPKLAEWLVAANQLSSRQRANNTRVTPEMMRSGLARMTESFVTRQSRVASITDTVLTSESHSVPLRVYDPAPDHPTPVVLFIHGGGHMCGSISVYDPICRRLAAASGQLIVAVEYRLAPEWPYPAALEDCLAVIRGLWSRLDQLPLRFLPALSLVGDSGGGALCATLSALSQQDNSLPIQRQALIYPSLDYTLSCPSVRQRARGYLLEQDRIEWYFDHYLQQNEPRREVSPLFMPISARHPATWLATAGFCPLRDEGVAYIDRLQRAGVNAQRHHEDTMIHAYLNLEDLAADACARTYQSLSRFLAAVLS